MPQCRVLAECSPTARCRKRVVGGREPDRGRPGAGIGEPSCHAWPATLCHALPRFATPCAGVATRPLRRGPVGQWPASPGLRRCPCVPACGVGAACMGRRAGSGARRAAGSGAEGGTSYIHTTCTLHTTHYTLQRHRQTRTLLDGAEVPLVLVLGRATRARRAALGTHRQRVPVPRGRVRRRRDQLPDVRRHGCGLGPGACASLSALPGSKSWPPFPALPRPLPAARRRRPPPAALRCFRHCRLHRRLHPPPSALRRHRRGRRPTGPRSARLR